MLVFFALACDGDTLADKYVREEGISYFISKLF